LLADHLPCCNIAIFVGRQQDCYIGQATVHFKCPSEAEFQVTYPHGSRIHRGVPPCAEGGLMSLSSYLHSSRARRASARPTRTSSFSSPSCKRPLKLSTKPVCIGFPGSMQGQPAPLSFCHSRRALEVRSVPLSLTTGSGLPWSPIRRSGSRATRSPDKDLSASRHEAFAGMVIDRRRYAQTAAPGRTIRHKVQGPAF